MSILEHFLSLTAISCFIFVGYVLLKIFLPLESNNIFPSLLSRIAASFGIGCSVLSLEMLFLSFFGIAFNLLVIMTPWVLLGIYIFYVEFGRKKPFPQGSLKIKKQSQSFFFIEKIFLVLIICQCLHVYFYATAATFLPYWDSVSQWGFKAKVFFLESRIPVEMFNDSSYHFLNPAYPLLLPLSETFIYKIFGAVNEGAANLISPCFFISILILFYYHIKSMSSRLAALIFTTMLAFTPYFYIRTHAGYADTILAFYLLITWYCFSLYKRENNSAAFFLTAFFAACAAWTKQEGILFCLVVCLFIAYDVFSKVKSKREVACAIKRLSCFVCIIAIFSLPWICFKSIAGLGTEYTAAGQSVLSFFYLKRLELILVFLIDELSLLIHWGSLFYQILVLFLVITVESFLHRNKGWGIRGYGYLGLFIVLQLGGYILIYLITPHDLIWQLDCSLSRLLIHITPLVFCFLHKQVYCLANRGFLDYNNQD